MSQPPLFRPFTLRGITAKNRILISPMCQYSAVEGIASDWHLVHLGKFAQGGAGIVMVEATAVTANGRITHGDLGLWHDGQIKPLERIAAFLRDNGAVPAIQLAHAGRKASMQRPWYGNAALTAEDRARGDQPWSIVAPSPLPMEEGWLTPRELSEDELEQLLEAWRAATLRAVEAGFEMLEVHCAHGYLLHSFLSPLSNKRTDQYGVDRDGQALTGPGFVAGRVNRLGPGRPPVGSSFLSARPESPRLLAPCQEPSPCPSTTKSLLRIRKPPRRCCAM